MRKKIFAAALALATVFTVRAQEITVEKTPGQMETAAATTPNVKVSGYFQVQNQWAQPEAVLRMGAPNSSAGEPFSRFGIRRGRVKVSYQTGITQAVFQLDITEKGIGLKDAYINIRAPFADAVSIKGGVFDRPFGHAISYSSANRESPERPAIFQTLFPQERDLGAMLTVQPPQTSPLGIVKLEAGLFAGNGIAQETDSRKDFIGHLSALKNTGALTLGGGVSYYNGSVYQGTQNVYKMQSAKFVLNTNESNFGNFARREYLGFDAQVSLSSVIGTTKIYTEYLFGTQPGLQNSTGSPGTSALPSADTWVRPFGGGYIMFTQTLGKLPVAIVAKYEQYDPNTQVAGNNTGAATSQTGTADLAQQTTGFGAILNINPSLRLTAYYDINRNETSVNIPEMAADLKNNIFTLRMQYKF